MDNENLIESNFRRDFLKIGTLAVAATACGSLACSCGKGKDAESSKKVKLLSPDGEIVEVDEKHLRDASMTPCVDAKDARHGIPNRKFVMVVDLARCKNARKCKESCNKNHHTGEQKEYLKVLKMQDNPSSSPYWQPTMCFHCDDPPCVKVCPVDATFKRDDGLVLIDNDRCIGCRFCMAACPYSQRVFNWGEPETLDEVVSCSSPEIGGVNAKKGTVEKCDFCPDMVREGALPHCVSACPNGVFYFGDENEDAVTNGEDTVKLSELLTTRAGYRAMEDLGTKPRVYYLPPVNRLFPFEDMENVPEENEVK
jgi:molybdopterin-containing oxidoreductase family iron-sulfur binding subunit